MNLIFLLRQSKKTKSIWASTSSFVRYSTLINQQIRFHETEDAWREKDGLRKDWNLIYKAPMNKLLNYLTVYLTCSTTTVTAAGAYYTLFLFDNTDFDKPILLSEEVVLANSASECFFYLGSFIAFHVGLRMLLSKYVIRLYQKEDTYLAIFRGHWYNSTSNHEFHLKEFSKIKANLILPWSHSRYALGKKKGIILEDYFRTPEYYNYLINKKSSGNV